MIETHDWPLSAQLEKSSGRSWPLRVVFCTNFLPPYRLPALKILTDVFQSFTVLLSTKMEEDRTWEADWRGVEVIPQRSLS